MLLQKIRLDMIPGGVPVVVDASQYDNGLRVLQFTLGTGSYPYTIEQGAVVSVRGTKPDNTGFEYPCTIESENVISVPIHTQMTVLAGLIPCEVRVLKNDTLIGSANFVLRVEKAAMADDIEISETDLPLIEKAAENIDLAQQAAAESTASAAASEASAQASAASASSAATSEANAAASEAEATRQAGIATDAKTAAQTAQNAAETARTAAEAAQSAAESARDTAQAAATTATTQAGNASASATAAATSETNAAASAQTAATQAGNAATSASSAASAMISAREARDDAQTAQGLAEDAQTAAETAQTAAEAAQTTAQTAAGNASTSATNAATSASNAATSESNAATSAAAAAASAQESAQYAHDYIPAGGTTGQALIKNSNTDYDLTWGSVSTEATAITLTPESGISIDGQAYKMGNLVLCDLDFSGVSYTPDPVEVMVYLGTMPAGSYPASDVYMRVYDYGSGTSYLGTVATDGTVIFETDGTTAITNAAMHATFFYMI